MELDVDGGEEKGEELREKGERGRNKERRR